MKKIDTLVQDIYDLFSDNEPVEIKQEDLVAFATVVATHVSDAVNRETRERKPGIYASELGEKCYRKLWFKHNDTSHAERLDGSTKLKFLYGNVIEELVLLLARLAGHKVEKEQHTLESPLGTVRGRIDAVIDGTLVDVKSASSYGFKKMTTDENWEDSFGYSEQLGFYAEQMPDEGQDPRFLLMNKESGALGLAKPHKTEVDAETKGMELMAMLGKPDAPEVPFHLQVDRLKELPVSCRYCSFKFKCHDTTVLKYANGHKFFNGKPPGTRVPDVTHAYKEMYVD